MKTKGRTTPRKAGPTPTRRQAAGPRTCTLTLYWSREPRKRVIVLAGDQQVAEQMFNGLEHFVRIFTPEGKEIGSVDPGGEPCFGGPSPEVIVGRYGDVLFPPYFPPQLSAEPVTAEPKAAKAAK